METHRLDRQRFSSSEVASLGHGGWCADHVCFCQPRRARLADLAIITDGISNRITRQIYQGLVRYKGATTEVIPGIGGEVGGRQGQDIAGPLPCGKG